MTCIEKPVPDFLKRERKTKFNEDVFLDPNCDQFMCNVLQKDLCLRARQHYIFLHIEILYYVISDSLLSNQ